MPSNGFAAQIQGFAKDAKANIDKKVRAITFDLFSGIIQGSPVDTGRFRANWLTTRNAPANYTVTILDPTGEKATTGALENMGGAGSVTYLSNNLPYAEVLEFGGYPNPPKRGSYVKGKGYVVKSVDGYSKQAPHGMVRVNLIRVANGSRK